MKAELIAVGTEILISEQITNTNTQFYLKTNELGIDVYF